VSLLVGLPTTLLRPNNEAMMKRYKMRTHYLDDITGLNQIISDEDPEGNWVLYEEALKIKDELKFYKRQLGRLEEQVSTMRKLITVTAGYWKD